MSAKQVLPDDGRLSVCPGGPLLVRHAHVVRDGQGQAHDATRPVVAVCRCGKSSLAPWCDGTHKVMPAKVDPA